MDDIKRQLSDLRRLDPNYEVFGAGKHRYRNETVSHEEIAWFEKQLGCVLPAEYRQFLLQTGHGAGPYYGIWSPHETISEFSDFAQDLVYDEGIRVSPSGDFPFTEGDLQEIVQETLLDHVPPWADRRWPNDGCIPIGHQGDTYWSILVLQGDFVGRIWDVACFQGHEGIWFPARRAPGSDASTWLPNLPVPPSFLDWYRGWLEQCLSDLRQLPSTLSS